MSEQIHVLSFTDAGLTQIDNALQELAYKFASPMLRDINIQLAQAEKSPKEFLAAIDAHLAPVKAKVASLEIEAKALLEKSESAVEHAVEAVKAEL